MLALFARNKVHLLLNNLAKVWPRMAINLNVTKLNLEVKYMSNIIQYTKYKEKEKLQLLSHNASFWHPATMWLSTVKLPIAIDNKWYETCLFSENESEPLALHSTLSEACSFHADMTNKFGLKAN